MKNIILEGFDGCGKSYLATILREEFGMPIYWAGGPPADFSEILLRLHEQLEAKSIIYDRITSISEACYREDISRLTTDLLRECRVLMAKRGDIFVHCYNHIGEDDTGFQNSEHQKMVEKRFININDNYDKIFRSIGHIKYAAKIDSIDGIVQEIRRKL